MKHINIIHIIFCYLLLTSCNRGQNENSFNSELLAINLENINENSCPKSLIDSVLYIPLETHSKGLITQIEKIIYSEGKFYILDRINRNGIMVFSDEGTFITTIGKIGRGPSEIIHLSNFDIKDNKVYIYDKILKEIKAYNFSGDFIDFFKIPNIQYDFSIIDSTKILRYWTGLPNESWEQVTVYDLLTDSSSNYVPIHSAFNNNKHASPPYEYSNHLYRSGDNILFNTYFSNIIHKSVNDTIVPYLRIESKALIGEKDIKRLIRNINKGDDKIARDNIIILSDIFQTDNILTFSIKNNNSKKIIYNFKSNNVSIFCDTLKRDELINLSSICGVKDNMFVSVLHPQLFQEKGNFNKNYLNYFINSKYTSDFIEKGVNSNPVIAIYNLKEF